MDCRTAESLVNGYINGSWSLKETERFIAHIKECSACYEELETYFIVSTAMQHLDGELGGTMNMKRLLEQDLKRREWRITKHNIQKFLMLILLCGGVCMVLALFGWLFLSWI